MWGQGLQREDNGGSYFSMGARRPLPLAGQWYTHKRKSLKDEDANLYARSLRMQCLIHRKGLTSSRPAPYISTSPLGVPLSWQTGCPGDGSYCGGETPGSAQTPMFSYALSKPVMWVTWLQQSARAALASLITVYQRGRLQGHLLSICPLSKDPELPSVTWFPMLPSLMLHQGVDFGSSTVHSK